MARPKKKAAAKSPLQEVWADIIANFDSSINPDDIRRSNVAKPWDIRVIAHLPQDESQPMQYDVRLTDFFKKNPNARFDRVAFAKRTVKVDGRKKNSPPAQIIAVFDSSKFKDTSADIRSNKGAKYINSRAHTLQLFNMFGVSVPVKRGETAELLLKCTQVVEGEGRDYLKVMNLTKFTQVKPEK